MWWFNVNLWKSTMTILLTLVPGFWCLITTSWFSDTSEFQGLAPASCRSHKDNRVSAVQWALCHCSVGRTPQIYNQNKQDWSGIPTIWSKDHTRIVLNWSVLNLCFPSRVLFGSASEWAMLLTWVVYRATRSMCPVPWTNRNPRYGPCTLTLKLITSVFWKGHSCSEQKTRQLNR